MTEVRGFGRFVFFGGIDERGDGSAVGGWLSWDGRVGLSSAL